VRASTRPPQSVNHQVVSQGVLLLHQSKLRPPFLRPQTLATLQACHQVELPRNLRAVSRAPERRLRSKPLRPYLRRKNRLAPPRRVRLLPLSAQRLALPLHLRVLRLSRPATPPARINRHRAADLPQTDLIRLPLDPLRNSPLPLLPSRLLLLPKPLPPLVLPARFRP